MLKYSTKFLIIILQLSISCALCKFSPGLKLHVSGRGVAAIVDDFKTFVDRNIRLDHEISNHSEQKLNVKFEIFDAKVETFRIGGVALAVGLTPDSSVIEFRHLDIQARSKWRYEVDALLKIKDKGNVKAEIGGASVDLTLPRAMIVDRRPYIPSVEIGCHANLPEISVSFEGARSTLYNILKPLFVSKVKSEIQQIVCLEARHLLTTYLNEKIDAFHTEYLLTYVGQPRPLLLDYTFLAGPLLSSDLIVTDHVGTVYPMESEKPLMSRDAYHMTVPSHIRNSTAHMHYLLNDAYFNSLFFTLFDENVVRKFKLSSSTVKKIFEMCSRETCGAMLHQVIMKFMAKSLAVTLELIEPATFTMTKHHVPVVTSECFLNFIITLPNNTLVQVFTGRFLFSYNLSLAVNDRGILYSPGVVFKDSKLIQIMESKIDVEPSAIIRFVKILNDFVLMKYVNELASVGLRLPTVQHRNVNVVDLEYLNDYVIIGVNFY